MSDIYSLSADEALNRFKAKKPSDDIYGLSAEEALKSRAKQPWEQYGVPRDMMSESAGKRFLRHANIALTEGTLGLKEALPFVDLTPEERQKLAAGKAYSEAEQEFLPSLGRIPVEAAEYSIGPMGVAGAGLRGLAGFAARTGAAGLTGGLLTPGEASDRAKGAAFGAGGSMVGEAIPYAFGTAKRMVEPFYSGGQQNILSRLLKRQVGNRAEDIATELESAASKTPGVEWTAAEAAPSSGGLAATQRWAEQALPDPYALRRAENVSARKAALEGIAGTEANKAAAIEARDIAAKPLYEEAMQTSVPVDESLRELFKRPSMRNALSQAQTIAAEQGTPIPADLIKAIESGEVPAEISGQGLHWLKVGLDSLRDEAKTSLSKAQQNALKGTVNAFEEWRGQNIPKYAEAQAAFRELSRPISRMDVGQSLYEKLAPALSDFGVLTKENAERYASALRNADYTAKQATGFKGARLSDIMQPSDIDVYHSVANDLTRQAQAATSGKGIGSDTFQKLAMQNIAERAGLPGRMLGRVTPLIGYMMKDNEEEMQRRLAEALLDPKKTAALLRRESGPLAKLFSASRMQPFTSTFGATVGADVSR